MKKETLFELLADVDETQVQKAGEYGKEVSGQGEKAGEYGKEVSGQGEGDGREDARKSEECQGKSNGEECLGKRDDRQKKLRRRFGKFGTVAAVLALLAGGALLWSKVGNGVPGQDADDANKGQVAGASSKTGENIDDGEAGFGIGTESKIPERNRLGEWAEEDKAWLSKVTVVGALLPEPVGKDMTTEEFLSSRLRFEWRSEGSFLENRKAAYELRDSMQGFYHEISSALLSQGDENSVCSPLNVYLALSLLAETTDGNSRKQIMDFLGVSDVETLRENVDVLWSSNYADTPTMKSILANSIWMRNDMNYDGETLQRLADTYHAFSFIGEMGSEEMNQGLRAWTNRATGGLLEQYVKQMSMSPRTILEMVSTLYFEARWNDAFQETLTRKETFHGTHGDQEVNMMHKTFSEMAYCSDQMTAIRLYLEDGGAVCFYLPEEGVTVEDLAADPETLGIEQKYVEAGKEADELFNSVDDTDYEAIRELWTRQTECFIKNGWIPSIINASVPKFRIDQKTDLIGFLEKQGITDVLNPNVSDFSPLTKETKEISLNKADHAVAVEIDEQGIKGAAYVEMGLLGAGESREMKVIDFVLDRPFLFIVYSGDGSVLFEGIVRNVE